MHRVEVEFPVRFAARSAKTGADVDVFAMVTDTVRLEDVDDRMMDEVFRAATEFGEHVVKACDGRLYRRISSLDEFRERRYGRAFAETRSRNDPGIGSVVGNPLRGGDNPLMGTVTRQLSWELDRESGFKNRLAGALPRRETSAEPGAVPRERPDRTLAAVKRHVDRVDEAAVERCLEMGRLQARKAVVSAGDVWMECGPVSWRVTPILDLSDGMRGVVRVDVEMAHVMEGFDPLLQRRHFPLAEKEAAEEYVAWWAKERPSDSHRRLVVRDEYGFEAEPGLMEFDWRGRHLDRDCYAMAGEIARHRERWKGEDAALEAKIAALPPYALEVLDRAYRETLATNYVTEDFDDAAESADVLVDVWNRLARPAFFCDAGPDKAKFVPRFIRDVKSAFDGRPIKVPFSIGRPGAGLRG